MSLSPQFLDELRARTCLSALIGKTVKLQKAGNEWKACCPFHQEKSASFYVNDDKGFMHCFGCGIHGDAIRWLQESNGMEFLDAVRELTAAAGMEMPARDSGQQERDERHRGVLDVLQRAAGWFAEQLQGVDGGAARAYLTDRGVTDAAVRAFGIGFAPDSRSRLRSALSEYGDAALIEAGVLTDPTDGREPYDRFRGRVIFPIRDPRGRVIAFGGRMLGPGEPKYLNSPESPIFDKGRSLYNLDQAAPAGRKAGRLIAVEGYMDVIAMWQTGIAETVAVNGTALSEAQIALMWRVTPTPLVCFDGDAAGKRAGAKAALRALPGIGAGKTLGFVALPPGKDPDDIAAASGVAGLERLLGAPLSLADLLWAHERDAAPVATPEARAALRQRLMEHAAKIADPLLRSEYEREFRERLYQAFRPPPFVKGAKRPVVRPPRTSPPPDPGGVRRMTVTAILRGLVRHPRVIADRAELIGALPVETEAQRSALDLILDSAFGGEAVDPAAVDALFPDELGIRGGFALSFLKPSTPAARAEADLGITLEVMIAQSNGVDQHVIVQMARDYKPPEEPGEGKLI